MLKMVNKIGDDNLWHPFRVIVGLREGYDSEQKLHRSHEVETAIEEWYLEAKRRGKPYLPGMTSEKKMHYLRRGDLMFVEDPVVVFEGEVNPLNTKARFTDEQYIKALWELAERLASILNQTRIYIKFKEHTIVLEEQTR